MAQLINRVDPDDDEVTSGELRLEDRLRKFLSEKYLVWFNIPVGSPPRYPDFLILCPDTGLLVLEVKDWGCSQIQSVSKERMLVNFNGETKSVTNPLEQARQIRHAVVSDLEKENRLLGTSGRSQGRLLFPYAHGVVLTRITRKELNSLLSEEDQLLVLPPHLVICKDEMLASGEPKAFENRLLAMFPYKFGGTLSDEQINLVRYRIFPDIRIQPPSTALSSAEYDDEVEMDVVKIMDLQQEQLARCLGEGHRVIHGVAGSGKTLILLFRCQKLVEELDMPILVICYNVALASFLRECLKAMGIAGNVEVCSFHQWCRAQLKDNGITIARPSKEEDREVFFAGLVKKVDEAIDTGVISEEQYGAVLVDEGHDFEEDWLRLLVKMVDKGTDSFLLLYDDAQSIYRKNKLSFPLSKVGIQARGRTSILKLNYRNPKVITHFAYQFSRGFEREVDGRGNFKDEEIPRISPVSAGIEEGEVTFNWFTDAREEVNYIISQIKKIRTNDSSSTIAIIYPYKSVAETFISALEHAKIKYQALTSTDARRRATFSPDKVTLVTRQSSKGLEFSYVFVPSLDRIPDNKQKISNEARMLYVAFTRATRSLHVSANDCNRYTKKIETCVTI